MIRVDSFTEALCEGTSKGNQYKFYKDGIWVKFDNQNCYEGLAEEFVSLFESCIYNFPYVKYMTDTFEYNDAINKGCYYRNMYDNINISFVSLRGLFKSRNIPLKIFLGENGIQDVREKVMEITNLDILEYLGRLLMLDCLIINEDRHYMNLGVCRHVITGKFGIAPCFDNGSSLFCVNWTYRKRKSIEENIEFAKSVARPFSKFFDKQLEGVLDLGCKPLIIDKSKTEWLLRNYHNNLYSDEINSRIKAVLVNRLRYYEGKCFVFV